MKVSKLFTSKYLKKEDFDTPKVLTIETVDIETIESDKGEQDKGVLFFREMDKGLVLNSGNTRELQDAYGDDTDDWKGKPCEVYVDPKIEYQGRRVGGLRVRIPMGTHQQIAKESTLAWTFDQAVKACYDVGISRTEMTDELKRQGFKAYNMLTCTPLVKQMIEAKANVMDKSGDDFGGGDIPFIWMLP